MKTTYVIKLVSPKYPNSRRFLRAVQERRITGTSHPALARSFATVDDANELIERVAYQTGYTWIVETYIAKGA
jgi:hypothetical protein